METMQLYGAAGRMAAAGRSARLLDRRRIGPGLLLCLIVSASAHLLDRAQAWAFGAAYIQSVALAIVIGSAVRFFWTPGEAWRPGIAFSAKTLLEIAIICLGASISAAALGSIGVPLILGIVAVLGLSLLASYHICRAAGLPCGIAVLIAFGTSICGNSAIAAAATVLHSRAEEIAKAIGLTALFGLVMMLCLPLLTLAPDLGQARYGIVAGMTVYAVPQVIAAASPAGPIAVQIGTLVKLVRVVMLGPCLIGLSLFARPSARPAAEGAPAERWRPLPWFVIGFAAMALLRSLDLLPQAALMPLSILTELLTVVSMAALGLGIDPRALRSGSGPAALAILSAMTLLAIMGLVLALLAGGTVKG